MPTYEYECDSCGHAFELFQMITAKPVSKCPQCGKNKVHRLIGCGSGLIFKGSGFYSTDYRSESYKKAAQSDSGNISGKTESSPGSDKKTGSPGNKKPGSSPVEKSS